jgi:hypothetical protein
MGLEGCLIKSAPVFGTRFVFEEKLWKKKRLQKP